MNLESVIEAFCPQSKAHWGHTGSSQSPHSDAIGPTVPAVPSQKHIDENKTTETGKQGKKSVTPTSFASGNSGDSGDKVSLNEAKLESFLERASILEYDGKLSRQEAEYRAFRLTWPEGSCTMLSASTPVEGALQHARAVFGDECQASPIEGSRERKGSQ